MQSELASPYAKIYISERTAESDRYEEALNRGGLDACCRQMYDPNALHRVSCEISQNKRRNGRKGLRYPA